MVDQREYCKVCDKWFADDDAYTFHKIHSRRHIACYICGREFKSQDGCTRHQHQEHAAEQDLACAGCGMKFNRIGGYISHIENHTCKVIRKEEFDRRRDEKELWHKTTMTGDTFGKDKSKPIDLPISKENFIVNHPPGPAFNKRTDFPALPAVLYKNGDSKVSDLLTEGPDDANLISSMWKRDRDNPAILFPNTPAVVSPPTDLLAALSIKNAISKDNDDEPLRAEYDPDHPEFDASKYYNHIADKYRCPWPTCNKMQSHLRGLCQHLKSIAHMNETLRCPSCLRIFNSATALAQHAESQALKCNIRNSEKYRQAVDQITGGLVDVRGRLLDDTVCYIAPENVDMPHVTELQETYWSRMEEERQQLLKNQAVDPRRAVSD